MQQHSLLAKKLHIPPIRPELVSRPRLIERLNAGLHRKLTIISAPVGFRKTTLISEPVDQAGLIGVINHVNMQALPLLSVECVSAPVENWPAMEGGH